MFVKGKSTLYETLPYIEGDKNDVDGIARLCIKDLQDSEKEIYFGPAYVNRLEPWLNRVVAGLRLYPNYIEVKLQ